jgi:hypothetical protein
MELLERVSRDLLRLLPVLRGLALLLLTSVLLARLLLITALVGLLGLALGLGLDRRIIVLRLVSGLVVLVRRRRLGVGSSRSATTASSATASAASGGGQRGWRSAGRAAWPRCARGRCHPSARDDGSQRRPQR